MLRQLLLAAVLLCSLSASAQDTIIYKDGTLRFARVIEISDQKVRFKNQDNPDGPDYVINTRDIKRIGYKNGTSDSFGSNSKKQQPLVIQPSLRPNYISLNGIDMMAGLVTVQYERNLKNPRFLLGAAVSSGIKSWTISGRNEVGNSVKYYSSSKPVGLTVNGMFYDRALQQPVNFGLGVELGTGLYYRSEYINLGPPYYNNYYEQKVSGYSTFAFLFSCKVLASEGIFVNFEGALGAQYSNRYYGSYYANAQYGLSILPYARFGVNLGYRF
jgi:hypothetical protein